MINFIKIICKFDNGFPYIMKYLNDLYIVFLMLTSLVFVEFKIVHMFGTNNRIIMNIYIYADGVKMIY